RRSLERVHGVEDRARDRARAVSEPGGLALVGRRVAAPAPGSDVPASDARFGRLRQLLPDHGAAVLLLVGVLEGIRRLAELPLRALHAPSRLVPDAGVVARRELHAEVPVDGDARR